MIRAIAVAAVAAAIACVPIAKPRTDAARQESPPNSTCQEAIVAFAEMHLDRWHGLPACTADDFTAALGAVGPAYEGGVGRIQRYAGRDATANGIEVHFAGDRVSHVIAFGPLLTVAEIESQLGRPEAVEPSRLFAPHNEQWIYASRGLAIHVERDTDVPGRVYGYAIMTVEQFKQSQLFNVEAWEHPTK